MVDFKAKAAKGRKAKNGTNGTNGKTLGTGPDGLIPESQVESAPDGYEEVFGERVKGWWALLAGNVLQGRLVDVFTTKSKFSTDGKRVYKVELQRPTRVLSAEEDHEGEVIEAVAGDLVGVDEKGFLKSLARLSIGQEIWVACLGKEGPSAEYPQGRYVFKGPLAKPAKVNPVTGEVRS